MTFLPVVARELRVSARKRSTFWLRVVAGLIALVIGAGFLVLSAMFGAGTAGLGGALFRTLTWLALAAAVPAGLFFTADSLSEEKREGTLGFLFLTDLRGYDVAAGKLLATSLRGSFALLAFFPVLATTFLMGGITGAEFWKTTLALVNVLFLSLTAGLLVSALSRDSQKAMGATFLVLLLLCAGGPLIDFLSSSMRRTAYKPVLSVSSPVYVFITAGAWGRTPYWLGLWLTNFCGWILLGLASWLVPRTWQDRARARSGIGSRFPWLNRASARARGGLRRKLLEKDPVLWLACRERWPSMAMWIIALLATAGFCLDLSLSAQGWAWRQISWLIGLVLYLWAASHACRLFVETRRGGFLELLLVTPLSVKDAAQGQWRAVLRRFGVPLVLLLAIDFAGKWLAQETMLGAVASQAGGAVPLMVVISLSAIATASVGLNLVALFWFGMWMGLTSRNASLAVLKTIAFVQIIPWFVINFLSGLAVVLVSLTQAFRTGAASGTMPGWFAVTIPFVMIGVASVLAIAKDLGLIFWARRRLYGCAREQAVLSSRPVSVARRPMALPPPQTSPAT